MSKGFDSLILWDCLITKGVSWRIFGPVRISLNYV